MGLLDLSNCLPQSTVIVCFVCQGGRMENQAVDMKKAQDDAQVSSLYGHRGISNKIGGGDVSRNYKL